MPLNLVARAESTTTFLLAQTLGSTKSVPVVSAKLPLDDDLSVVGSFEYRGITYAVEPGGESVAIVAVDPNKLPTDFIEAQTIVLPSAVSIEGADPYSVTRIAEGAFSSLTAAAAAASSGAVASAPEDGASSDEPEADAPEDGAPERAASGPEEEQGEPSSALDGADATDEDGASSDEADANAAPGITAITIPASVTTIDDGAFTGFETLQYVIVSADNPNYSMYDGCLYDKPQQSLLLIPGGRLGAVRVASTTTSIPQSAYSHCASLSTLIVDPASAASQLIEGDGSTYKNANGERIETIDSVADESPTDVRIDYSRIIEVKTGDEVDLAMEMFGEDGQRGSFVGASSSDSLTIEDDGTAKPSEDGAIQVVGAMRKGGSFALQGMTLHVVEQTDREDEAVYGLDEDDERNEARALASSEAIEPRADGSLSHQVQVTNGGMTLTMNGLAARYVISCVGGYDGTISWTGGSDAAPSFGSIVNVYVTRLVQTGSEATPELLSNASIKDWGATREQEFSGFRNRETGSFVSVDNLFSGEAFSFSFIFPERGCSVGSGGLQWITDDTTFEPVYNERTNSIFSHFSLNASDAFWENAGSGTACGSATTRASTYSTLGTPLLMPTRSIPVRPGHVFLGWYADEAGTRPVPAMAAEECHGTTYYAKWGVTGGVHPNITNGALYLRFGDSSRYVISCNGGFDGSISWTGGTSTDPTPGSIVNVYVTRLHQTGAESTPDLLQNASIVDWEGTREKELIGFRNRDTGSFVSVDNLFSGEPFSFSLVMPASGCIVSSGQFSWINGTTTFEPVYTLRENALFCHFGLNAPDAGWENSSTGTTAAFGGIKATVYSEVGGPLMAPSRSIPYRSGYTFLGWYEDADGTQPIPAIATEECHDQVYYAKWGVLGGSYEGITNGTLLLKFGDSSRYVISSSGGFDGSISWTGGTSAGPVAGSAVNVYVTRLYQHGHEGTPDLLQNASVADWGGTREKELVGFRNKDTGSFVSVDNLFSGEPFSFSLVMPASGCIVSSGQFSWINGTTTFEPVFSHRDNSIYCLFSLNGPDTKWENSATGFRCGGPIVEAAVYSTLGEAIAVPTKSIPRRDGYRFMGWYTAPEGGYVLTGNATEADHARTYYARWSSTDSKFYFLAFNENAPSGSSSLRWTNDVNYGFSLPEDMFTRTGHTCTSWNTMANGGGTRYEIGQDYGALGESATLTLYAQWTLDTYKMSYDLAGGTEAQGGSYPQEYSYGEGTIEVSDPVRPGYEFLGWVGTGLASPTKGLSIDRASNDKLGTHAAGSALYERSYQATWRAYSYDLELYDGDVSVSSQQDLAYGQPHDIDASAFASRKPGYHVSGWKIGEPSSALEIAGEKGPVPATFDEAAPEGDGDAVRLYCIWQGNPYKVRFFDGSELRSEQTGLVYGTSCPLASQTDLFRKDDLTLVGWAYSHEDADYGMNAKPVEVALDAVLSTFEGHEPAKEGGTLDLYAVWAPVITASVPLQSSIAFDPDRPYAPAAFKAGTAAITTSGRLALRVSSLALERTEGSSDGATLGTSEIFSVEGTDRSSSVELTVEGDRPDGASSSPLTLNLGADGQKVPSAAHGMGAFDKESPLNLSFGLTFLPGCPDPSSFEALSDPSFKDAYEQDGSRKAYRLARLLFTLEMAPPLS